ncbi:unnamed protein product, partial [Didymodactylos carnosus]
VQQPKVTEAIMQPLLGSMNQSQPQSYPFHFSQQQQQLPQHFTDYTQNERNPESVTQDSVKLNPVQPPFPPTPVVKPPLSSDHQKIQDVFDALVQLCHQATQQQPLKRKLEDVNKKLEILYDKLRENNVCTLSTITLRFF